MTRPISLVSPMGPSISLYNMNPCVEVTLEAKDFFTSYISFMDSRGMSLYRTLSNGGYTLEDVEDLIRTLYNVEDFYGDFVGENSTDVSMATRVLTYIKNLLSRRRLLNPPM